ncbi:toll/interleukin-1 receptor domain-containing protein [Priestia megaterium]|uniref:toll/interleukin-1 receptor domain-containing protein n=1 Tax=Priestia megaterium TaxID=1404 RepID=UPI001D17A330|nr:TIR domain-containing protein [Priestia megaterium]
MTQAEFKVALEGLKKKLKEITENNFFNKLQYYEEIPFTQGQYWGYELSIIDKYDSCIHINCGFFTASGQFRNKSLNINDFFFYNEEIGDEFYRVEELGLLNELIAELNKFDYFEQNEESVSLNVHSYIVGGDQWLQQVCQEYILILCLDDNNSNNLHLGIQQNERIKIKVSENGRNTYFKIPFDKSTFFENHEKMERTNMKAWEYDVVLSFAGEDRKYVYEIADTLKSSGIKVFYDKYEVVSLWGKDLYSHLDDIYRNKSMYCVMFLSKNYKKKVWTNHERESAQARAFEEKAEYILPIRLDETEIPGIKSTTGYISANEYTPRKISEFIEGKVKEYIIV